MIQKPEVVRLAWVIEIGCACALGACVPPPMPTCAPGGSPAAATAAGATSTPAAGGAVVSAPPAVSASLTGAKPYTWKNVTILGGGFVSGVIFSPKERGLVYARTDVGGAYRMNADGSWTAITDGFGRAESNYLGIESLAADPVDANRVYVALGTYTQAWAGLGAIGRSQDRGNTWKITPMTIKMGGNEYGRSNGERLAVDPNQNSTLYFGSRRDGLWKSTDAAATWSNIGSFPAKNDPAGIGINFVLFDRKSGAKGNATPTLYVGVASNDTGLYRSTDAGKSWKPVPRQPKGVMPTHADFDAAGSLYLSYGNTPGPGEMTTGGVWKLDGKSDTWTDITPLAPGKSAPDDKFGYAGLSVDAAHPGTLMVTTLDRWTHHDEVFRTTDGGKRWTPLIASAERSDAGAIYLHWHRPGMVGPPGWNGDIDIDPFDPGHVFHVTGQGIWGTDNATAADSGAPTKWSFRNRGLEETVISTLSSPPAGPPLLSGMGDICGFRHDDLSVAPPQGMFDNPVCGNTSGLDFAETKPNLVVRVGSNQGKHGAYSLDAGNTWTQFEGEPDCGLCDRGEPEGSGSVALSADGKTIVWAPRKANIAVSRDNGATWTKAEGLPAPATIPDWAPLNTRVVSDRVNPSKFYIFDALTGIFYASADGGAHFEATKKGLPRLPDYQLTSAGARSVPGFEGDVWLSTGKALYHSTDSGKSFAAVTVKESHSVGFGKGAAGAKYPAVYLNGKVDTVDGFFRSDDGGASWVRINDDAHQFGGGNVIIGDPRVYGRVYLGTGGRGILYGEPR